MQKVIIPKDTSVNFSFEIPEKYVGKPLKIYIDFEDELENELDYISDKDFEKWVLKTENSKKMSLENFKIKWNQEIIQIKKNIL